MPDLPQAVLYATSARFGGTGLDLTAVEGLRASVRAGILRRGISYGNGAPDLPAERLTSLAWHPVRLLSGLGSQRYYGAKKRYVDWVASLALGRGGYDLFHGWSGDALRTLLTARQLGVPSVLDIPTWHRNKGHAKPFETKTERQLRAARGLRARLAQLPPSRQHVLLEYALADVILTPSRFSAQTFLAAGVPAEKLHYVGRGADLSRYRPADAPPPLFRLVFAGALIKRKGVHHLLEAWRSLNLKDAELVLTGAVHEEIQPALREYGSDSVKVTGFSGRLEDQLRQASAFVFPSECEGFAKVTLEAAACGLPLITTAESGDACVDGETGLIIPPNNVAALAGAIEHLHRHPEKLAPMGAASRARVAEHFTWEHYRTRVLEGYRRAVEMRRADV